VSKIKRKLKDFIKLNILNFYKKSYAQCGEDMVLDCIFRGLNIKNGTYLDIGAHHPYYLSNTQFLYDNGFNGVNCEPNPYLYKMFKLKRKRDTNLNIGISIYEKNQELDFYIMNAPTLSTFSKEEANRYVKEGGYKIEQVLKAQTYNINNLIEKYCKGTPNLISIDIEGLDYLVLKTLNFDKYRPEVFCIETAVFNTEGALKKNLKIHEYMLEKDYFIYADLYENTIFVDNKKYKNRKCNK
jgi:FkbM family methyltransferase